MIELDERIVQQIASLRYEPRFQDFMKTLQEALHQQRALNDTATGVELHWSQGRCQCLDEILNMSKRAEEYLHTQQQLKYNKKNDLY